MIWGYPYFRKHPEIYIYIVSIVTVVVYLLFYFSGVFMSLRILTDSSRKSAIPIKIAVGECFQKHQIGQDSQANNRKLAKNSGTW